MALKRQLKKKNFQKVGKEIFKFPVSVVRDIAQSEDHKDDSFMTSDISSSSHGYIKLNESKEKEGEMAWCSFSDFCKFHKDGRGFNLNEAFKKANWHAFVKQKAFHTIREAENFQVRNR